MGEAAKDSELISCIVVEVGMRVVVVVVVGLVVLVGLLLVLLDAPLPLFFFVDRPVASDAKLGTN